MALRELEHSLDLMGIEQPLSGLYTNVRGRIPVGDPV